MAIYKLKVAQRGTIIVDGVDSLEDAEEYIKSCNPVNEVNWLDSLEVMQGGIQLILPDYMGILKFAEKIGIRPQYIVKWLFMRGRVADFKSAIGFNDMSEFANEHGFICEKEVEG